MATWLRMMPRMGLRKKPSRTSPQATKMVLSMMTWRCPERASNIALGLAPMYTHALTHAHAPTHTPTYIHMHICTLHHPSMVGFLPRISPSSQLHRRGDHQPDSHASLWHPSCDDDYAQTSHDGPSHACIHPWVTNCIMVYEGFTHTRCIQVSSMHPPSRCHSA